MDPGVVELLELFEYKVDDLVAGKTPRGGWASLIKLRQELLQQPLSGPLIRRFRQADQTFRQFRQAHLPDTPSPAPTITVFDQPLPPSSPEREVLDRLRERLFWLQAEREAYRIGKLLVGGKREELRFAYSLLRNLETYEQQPQFRQDYNLSRFEPSVPIPALSDSLAQLDDPQVAQRVLFDLAREAYRIPELLGIPPEETLAYLRRMSRKILDNDAMLRPLRNRTGPSMERLRQLLSEARQRNAPSSELRTLEEQLHSAAAEERRLSLLLAEDRDLFSGAAERLFQRLSRLLPSPRGTAALPEVPQKILGAQDPELALPHVDPQISALNLRLAPLRLQLGPLSIGLYTAEGEYTLSLEGQEYPLAQEHAQIIPSSGFELWVVRFGEYLHLGLRAKEGARLSRLLIEGEVLGFLLAPEGDYPYLRLLRALHQRLRDPKAPLDPQAFAPSSAQRYAEAPLEALQDFARKGLAAVASRLAQVPQWPQLLEEAGSTLGLKHEAKLLQELLQSWQEERPTQTSITLSVEGGFPMLGEVPVDLHLGSLHLSARLREGTVYVTMAGAVPRKLEDLLLWPTPEGFGLIVREGNRIAYRLLPHPSSPRRA